MLDFQNLSGRAVAAVSSFAFSIVIFAVAIVPANHGHLLPAGIA